MISFLLGGTASGKSVAAEAMLDASQRVTYVATSVVDPADAEWIERVQRHRDRRPATWATVECGDALPSALAEAEGAALVDSLGSWISACPGFGVDTLALTEVLKHRRARGLHTVVVSDEAGLAPHAATPVVRDYVGVLGALNQAVATLADEAFLVVAGRLLALPPRVDRP